MAAELGESTWLRQNQVCGCDTQASHNWTARGSLFIAVPTSASFTGAARPKARHRNRVDWVPVGWRPVFFDEWHPAARPGPSSNSVGSHRVRCSVALHDCQIYMSSRFRGRSRSDAAPIVNDLNVCRPQNPAGQPGGRTPHRSPGRETDSPFHPGRCPKRTQPSIEIPVLFLFVPVLDGQFL